MLTFLAYAMVATFITLIMTKRVSALVGLVLIPLAFALMAGFTGELGPMMLQGVRDIAPTGIMLLFAILYFGLMIDAGLFDPLVTRIVKLVGNDPFKIVFGTAVLAMLISLDGDGSTTYMITAAAMFPLYRHARLDTRKLACVTIMAGMAANLLPWGGPTARAAAVLNLQAADLYLSVLPAQIACFAWVLVVAAILGLQERRRVANLPEAEIGDELSTKLLVAEDNTRDLDALRPKLFVVNLLLTVALLVALVTNILPLPVLFIVAYATALLINYPSLAEQRRRLAAHAGNALAVAGLVFAAGTFTGILSGTGMVDAMTASIVQVIPPELGRYMTPITALLSVPFTFLVSNDAFYFGMLPILASTAESYGISKEMIGRASLVGQQFHLLSPLVPSTYLLVGLARIEFGELLRFASPWALGTCVVMFLSCLLFRIFPWAA